MFINHPSTFNLVDGAGLRLIEVGGDADVHWLRKVHPPRSGVIFDDIVCGQSHFRKKAPVMESSGTETTRPVSSDECCDGFREET